MIIFLEIIGWLLLGCISPIYFWWQTESYNAKWAQPPRNISCPTPYQILIGFLWSFMGPVFLVVIFALFFMWTIEMIQGSSWWNTPVCDRNKKS